MEEVRRQVSIYSHLHNTVAVLSWGSISTSGVGDPFKSDGNMNTEKYLNITGAVWDRLDSKQNKRQPASNKEL